MSNNRRDFLRNTTLATVGLGFTNITKAIPDQSKPDGEAKSRNVWIASLSQNSLKGNNVNEVIQAALKEMEMHLSSSPDIFCLPEVFHAYGVKGGRPPLALSSEDGSGNLITPFQSFAKKNNCYIICPIYTFDNGKYYNAAVVINREGKKIGEYRKIRLTAGEIEKGLTPGPLDPPVFQTDFGLIGIQICRDIDWQEGWMHLGRKGAEIVFWPSAYSGGKILNARAWENQYYVVSSTRGETNKIIDLLGRDIIVSGSYSRWGLCTSVNLEKAFLHSYPSAYKFMDIQRKYGRKVSCYTLHDEEFSIIESLSPDVKVSEILKEFNLMTNKEEIERDEKLQQKMRV